VLAARGIYTTENQGVPSDLHCADRTAVDYCGHQRFLGRILAQAGGVRGLLWQPARRFSGRGPRRDGKEGRGPVFACGLKRGFVNSTFCHFILTIFQKHLFVFKYIFDIYSNLNQRDNLFRGKK
jgi:hypothetical protein